MKVFPADSFGYLNSLEGVEVGDTFMVVDGTFLKRVECNRVMPTQCEIGRHRYRIKDARAIGADSYCRIPYLQNFDAPKFVESEDRRKMLFMRRHLQYVRWMSNDIPDATISTIFAILKAAPQGTP